MMRRRTATVVVLGWLALVAGGCGFNGPNSQPLPFAKGGGSDALTVTVTMADVGNLTPNAEVKVADVTVGSVRRIAFVDWKARVTVGLERGVSLPADAVVRIGQKSLLGAEYLEMAAPPGGGHGRLRDGDVIPESRAGSYPGTEQVLTAAGTVLGGGGLEHVADITRELNAALGGRESDWRDLITELAALTHGVNRQRDALVSLLQNSDDLAGRLNAQRRVIDRALATIPAGLGVADAEQARAFRALTALRQLSGDIRPVVNASGRDVAGNLGDLSKALDGIASAGKDLPGAMGVVTFPLPIDSIPKFVKGDYFNLWAHIDLRLSTLDHDFLGGTPFEGLLTTLGGKLPSQSSLQSGNPLTLPLTPAAVPSTGPTASATPPTAPPAPTTTTSPAPSPGGGLLGQLLGGLTGTGRKESSGGP